MAKYKLILFTLRNLNEKAKFDSHLKVKIFREKEKYGFESHLSNHRKVDDCGIKIIDHPS